MKKYDSIIIGHYETNFNAFAKRLKIFSDQSGAYHELVTNSVILNGKRATYTEMLNAGLEAATGKKWGVNPFNAPHLGVYYLTSFLRQRGFNVRFVNFFNSDKNILDESLESAKSVAITTTYYITDEAIVKLVRYIKSRRNDIPIIVGGPRIFGIYQSFPDKKRLDLHLKSLGADIYVIDSQGEKTLATIVKAIADGSPDFKKIPNIIFKENDGGMSETDRIPEKNDLNENMVRWSLFRRAEYTPTVFLRAARSCPFACAFCNYPSFAGQHALVDLDILEKELSYLNRAGVKNVIFIDDSFNVPLPRFKSLLRRMIKNKYDFRWISNFRCSSSDEETFDLMSESGCMGVYLGIESGDQQILNNMNKRLKVEQYYSGIASLKKRKIMTLASIIVGFPGENERSVKNTISLLEESGATFYGIYLYYHNPMSPIDSKRKEYGIVNTGFSWSHHSMNWKEAIHWKEHLIRNVKNSTLMPLSGMSIWSLPYLLEQGLSLKQLLNFFSFGNDFARASLDKQNMDINSQMNLLADIFSDIQS